MKKILGGVLVCTFISVCVYLYASTGGSSSHKTITLSEDKEALEEYKGASGQIYSIFFLSTKDKINKDIWNRKLRKAQIIKQNFEEDGFFKDLKTVENITQEQLMNKCKEAYKSKTKDEEHDKWNEVWNLCSIFQVKPSLIADIHHNDYKDQTHGKTGEEQLISTNSVNDRFWKIQQERFKDEKPNIEEWCSGAYIKKNTDEEYSDEQVYKYCSLEGFKKTRD